MRLAGILSVSTVLLLPLLLVLGASPPCHGAASHNITDILAAHPDFSEFSAALTSTGATAEINNHGTITVLALNNSVMAQLKAQQLQPRDLQHVIYLHGLLDYLDATKLGSIRDGSAQATSLYQATGKAQSNEGMVNITVFRGGRVEFALSTNTSNVPPPPAAIYQKSIKEVPYDIAVLQVSAPIWSPAPVPGAPAPPPSSPGHGTAPATSPAHAPPPAPAPASSPAHAPPPPAPAPASSPAAQAPTPPAVAPPAIPPTSRRHPAPPQEADTPADSPDADSEPPADQKSNGTRDTASWSLGMAMAAAVPVVVLLMW